jgi:hypothetical protein
MYAFGSRASWVAVLVTVFYLFVEKGFSIQGGYHPSQLMNLKKAPVMIIWF